jgi:hypothetical protein
MKKHFKSDLIRLVAGLFFGTLGLAGCKEPGGDTGIGWNVTPLDLEFEAEGGVREIEIKTVAGDVVDFDNVTVTLSENATGWATFEKAEGHIDVTIGANQYNQPRSTVLDLTFDGVKRQVVITQGASAGLVDKLITVTGATATSEEVEKEKRPLTNSYDGDFATFFNSKYGEITEWPFFLEYTLKTPNKLNHIIYYPRTDGNQWGSFNEFDVYITTEANPDKVKIASLKRGDGVHTPCKIVLDKVAENVKTVRFEVRSAFKNRVSCAEMEFHEVSGTRFDYTTIFADAICSALKPGVTAKDIAKLPDQAYRTLASGLLDGSYKTAWRVAEFRPYQDPLILKESNRLLHSYCLRDNPTGIYVDEGDELNVLVEDTKGQSLSLVVQNLEKGYGASRTIMLEKGENKIKSSVSGLIYVQNITKDPIPLVLSSAEEKAAAAAKTVRIHFMSGKVQGYYRKGVSTDKDWNEMLSAARYKDIDVIGDYALITWNVEDFKTKTPGGGVTDIATVIENYDRLTWLEQKLMGTVKYNKMSRNRMYYHLDYNGASPYATMYRTAYTRGYAELFCNAARFGARIWGPGHEAGHINQTHGFKWSGTTEVVNNIFTLYVQQQQTTEQPRLMASKAKWDGTEYPNLYEAAIAAIVKTGNPHCLTNQSNEFMIKLVPFWQLQLYLADALGKTDFYADVFEYYRTRPTSAGNLTHGEQQLLFVEVACKVANLDLTGFFEKWGFLTPVSVVLDDYGKKPLDITAEQVADTKARIAAAGYPAPPHTTDGIIAIRDNNVNDYKAKK